MALANSGMQEVDGMETENSNNFVFLNTSYSQPHDHHQQQEVSESVINFKCGIIEESSVVRFEGEESNYSWDQQRVMENPNNYFQTATNYYNTHKKHNKTTASATGSGGLEDGSSAVYEWLIYSEATAVSDAIHHSAQPPHHIIIPNQKRSLSLMGESSGGVCKKQCTASNKKQKPKSSTAKDPQSIAAKNRRERISERLKILQELVPNGSKVDLVTMLEKAISYVKFLQLQVKILATDEFWPVQGGKAPDISQVKEAIDVILSSQRERSSSSNSEK